MIQVYSILEFLFSDTKKNSYENDKTQNEAETLFLWIEPWKNSIIIFLRKKGLLIIVQSLFPLLFYRNDKTTSLLNITTNF